MSIYTLVFVPLKDDERRNEMTTLTQRLKDYLNAIQRLYRRTGRCTLAQIGEEVFVSSKGAVYVAIQRLVALGLVRCVPAGRLHYYEPANVPSTSHPAVFDLLNELRRLDNDGTLPGALRSHEGAWK